MIKGGRLCQLLGIEYPIIQAPMAWVANASLAASVSNTGGLGTIGISAGMEKQSFDPEVHAENVRNQIRKIRNLTSKPFAVNVMAVAERFSGRQISEARTRVIIEEEIPVAIVSMGSPGIYTKLLKEAGIKVLHAVGSVKHAKLAEQEGVDAVIVEGYEGGGHGSYDALTIFTFVPMVAEVVSIPVIAGGGIADARGIVAAFALGAEGVYIGTRFLNTKECPAHPNVKQSVINADDTSTVSYGSRKVGTGLMRALRNRFIDEYLEMEAEGSSGKELRHFEHGDDEPQLGGHRRYTAAMLDGNLELGIAACGQVAGMIKDAPSVEDVIHNMVEGTKEAMENLNRQFPWQNS